MLTFAPTTARAEVITLQCWGAGNSYSIDLSAKTVKMNGNHMSLKVSNVRISDSEISFVILFNPDNPTLRSKTKIDRTTGQAEEDNDMLVGVQPHRTGQCIKIRNNSF